MLSTGKLLRSTIIVTVITALCVAYGYFIEPRRLVVNSFEVRPKNWDPAFDGFRVALISDIHGGSNYVTTDRLRSIVEMTNKLDPDAIFLLGDYVSQSSERGPDGRRGVRMPPSEIAEALSGMRSKYGTFVVLGNHDEWYDPTAVMAAFERVGYTVLNGKVAEIKLNGGKIASGSSLFVISTMLRNRSVVT